jgi:hypothetical protein
MKSNKYSSLLPVVVINPLDFSKLATPPNCPVRLSLGSFFKKKLLIGLSHVWRAHMVYVHWVQHPVYQHQSAYRDLQG